MISNNIVWVGASLCNDLPMQPKETGVDEISAFCSVELADTDAFEQIGALSLEGWLWAGGLTIVALVAALMASQVVKRIVGSQLAPFVTRLLGRIAAIVVFLFGFFYAMQKVGVSLAPFLGLAGLLGLAFAFAFQDVLENFIAGIMLSARRPFSQGDEITTTDHEGWVEDISLRGVTLRTYDGKRVFVPNADVWQNPLTNHTAYEQRRTTLLVGVGYGSSLPEAQEVLLRAVGSVVEVDPDRQPEAFVDEFGASSINFAVRFWHRASIRSEWEVRNDVAMAIHEELDAAGIEIPFPQRVLTFVNQPLEVAASDEATGPPS